MANQGYLGHKTHPARAIHKVEASFFSLLFSTSVCMSVCLLLSLSRYVYPRRYKGATSLVASLRNQSRGPYKYISIMCVCVCVCVCMATDVLYRLKICVTDKWAKQMARFEWDWAINAWASTDFLWSHQKDCLLGVLIKV